jgi:hypothetical protein
LRTPVPPTIGRNPLAARDHKADGAKGGRARGGRPPKLDDARFAMIITSLKAGNTRKEACHFAGVLPGSLHYLMATNSTAKLAVLQAEAHAVERAVLTITSSKDPRWLAWWLAHNPGTRDLWGEKPSRSTTFVGGQPQVTIPLPSFDRIVAKITQQRMAALERERAQNVKVIELPSPQEHVETLVERRAEGPLPD